MYFEYYNKVLVLATEPGCKFNNCTFNLDDGSLGITGFEIKNKCRLLNSSINCGSVDLQEANTEIIIGNCEINTSHIDFSDSDNCQIINTKIDLNINSKAKKESIDFLVNLGSAVISLRMEKTTDLINFFKNNNVPITQDLLNFADKNDLVVIRLSSYEDIKEKDFKGTTIFVDNKEAELLDIFNFKKFIDWNGKTQAFFKI